MHDNLQTSVFQPMILKVKSFKSATIAATVLLRKDDIVKVILEQKLREEDHSILIIILWTNIILSSLFIFPLPMIKQLYIKLYLFFYIFILVQVFEICQ